MQRWHLLFLLGALGVFEAHALGASGTIAASPNPCVVPAGASTCTSYITWSTQGVTHARVYVVDSHKKGKEEQEFGTHLSCVGEKCRASWIEKGNNYVFTLYDYSSGNRGSALGSVTVTGQAGGAHK
ncbi:MAG: hypothetical protein LAP39_06975 [Acidobacteriia bacterium]|nr:hypothetical protein [Terriglobia bacterium]